MTRKLHAAGYAAITVPKEYGGQGGEGWMQRAFNEEAADRNVNTGFYGSIIGMAAPALLYFGTEEQKLAHLPGMVSGAVSWCQLFSEPGAGSDLAGLGARAERDGDEFVINGQKVWNSAAMYADMGILLVRTDPDAVKHAGISFLLFDMRQPGVEVRRLVQANGAGHFAEVFLSDARCPVANVLGGVERGLGAHPPGHGQRVGRHRRRRRRHRRQAGRACPHDRPQSAIASSASAWPTPTPASSCCGRCRGRSRLRPARVVRCRSTRRW